MVTTKIHGYDGRETSPNFGVCIQGNRQFLEPQLTEQIEHLHKTGAFRLEELALGHSDQAVVLFVFA